MNPWVDLHNHLMPRVDDGARDPDEAAAAARALEAEGVRLIVTTPHVDGSVSTDAAAFSHRMGRLDAAWERLLARVDGAATELRRGAEVKLDVPRVDLDDPRLRLGGSAAVLVEFPHMGVPPRSPQVLEALRTQGYVPLLAHPERYDGLGEDLAPARAWVDAGAYLQVNAGSLLGRYGSRAQQRGWSLLEEGLVTCIASDYHARGDLVLRSVRERLAELAGEETAELLFDGNPSRLLRDEAPSSVPPVRRPEGWRGALKRLLGR